uniref:Holo-[acyl-carrier-protein] synthase n=1 Tax=Ammonifex degensii TaxID=42838 RepID=A0A7C2EJJ8_9THEO
MLIGIGADIIEVERICQAFSRWGERFLRRVYTPAERAYCSGKANNSCCWAGRFAAKEAVLKALGIGRTGAGFSEVEVLNDPAGQPLVVLRGRAARAAKRAGVARVLLSIAHGVTHAVAFAVAEGEEGFFAPGYGTGDAGD